MGERSRNNIYGRGAQSESVISRSASLPSLDPWIAGGGVAGGGCAACSVCAAENIFVPGLIFRPPAHVVHGLPPPPHGLGAGRQMLTVFKLRRVFTPLPMASDGHHLSPVRTLTLGWRGERGRGGGDRLPGLIYPLRERPGGRLRARGHVTP